jgi:hypothetical protein
MLTLEYLKQFIKEKVDAYPKLKDEIMDYYSLCISEIEEGAPEYHEVGMCMNDIEELIEEN